MELTGIFLWVVVFAAFFIVLLHLAPSFRGRAYYTAKESNLRIVLTSFLIFLPFFLVMVFISPLAKIGMRTFVGKITELWPSDKVMAIFAPATIFFLALGGISIPLAAAFHYLFGFRFFLLANKKCELSPQAIEENLAIRELLDVFSNCLKTAREKRLGKVFLLDEASRASPVFSGCGIVGKGKSLALLFSRNFVKAFEDKQLTKEDVEAIFFHEIGHIVNKDYYLPLWSKMFIQSRLFFVAWASLVVGAVCASTAFAKIEGLSAVLNWDRISTLVIMTFGFVLLKGVIRILISGILRGREYLADKHATYHYTDRETMTKAIRKSALLFAGASEFSWLSFGETDSAAYAITKDQEENVLSEIKQFFSELLGGKASWHPDPVRRIKALNEQPAGFLRKMGKRSIKDMVILALFVSTFFFVGALIIEFFAAKLEWLGPRRIYDLLNNFFILSYLLAIFSLVIEHIFPFQFWDAMLFQKSLVASWTSFLIGRTWLKIHIKNYFIALIPCLLGRIVTNIFATNIRFFYWCKWYLLSVFLASFGVATLLSIFLISRYWRQKSKQWLEKEEVPVEEIIE